MTTRVSMLSAALVLCAFGASAAETNADLANQVRETEIAFAKTMADRNHAAFVSFLAEETIFLGGKDPVRGRQAVAEAWKRFYEGPRAPFSWGPERVEVLDSGTLAISTGPVFDPDGKRTGTFTSTWRREADGRWRIVLDSGCPPCACPPSSPQ
jgi:ketosteroid isomerase-like protein